MIDRGDYWQIGYVIEKGGDRALRAGGIDAFRSDLADVAPALADRVDELASMDDVNCSTSGWTGCAAGTPRLLCIGDAAHAMSPVGGVGINLAVQDAVAAARILAAPLAAGGARCRCRCCEKVQLRRWWPTALVQGAQRLAHRQILTPMLASGSGGAPAPASSRLWPAPATPEPSRHPPRRCPRAMRLLRRFPVLQGVPGAGSSRSSAARARPGVGAPPGSAGPGGVVERPGRARPCDDISVAVTDPRGTTRASPCRQGPPSGLGGT